jgi:signal transduction histidine kinase
MGTQTDLLNFTWGSDVDWIGVTAETLGMDAETFYDIYTSEDESLVTLAQAHGVDPNRVVQNIIAAEQAAADQAVAAGYLSPEDAAQYMKITQAFAAAFVFYDNQDSNVTMPLLLASPENVNLLLGTFYLDDEQRLVVVSRDGFVVYDSLTDETENLLGSHIDKDYLKIGVPLHHPESDDPIGTAIVGSFSGLYGPQQEIFLQKIQRSLLVSGVIASVFGVLVGIWLSTRITAPVTALTRSARSLGEQRKMVKLPVRSDNELGQMTAAFNRMIDALEEQRALRGRLLNDVAHELNTPLSVIQLELDALRDGLQNPEAAATQVQQEIEHLKNLINDLTWLSETDDGNIHLDLQTLDLCAETRKLAAHWEPLAAGQGVKLTLEIAPALRENCSPVNGDLFRLTQVFRNVVDNALRYTPKGGSITISLTEEDLACQGRTRGCLVTRVRDTGAGIPPEDVPHIFERFFRVDSSRSRQKGGRGLGLAIVQRIIEGHGGEVWAESQVGKGTTIAYALPLSSD